MLNPNSPQRSAASVSNSGGAGQASVPAQPLVLQLPAPHPLRERMNRREWKTWRQQWEDYAQVSRIGEQSKKYQAAVLRGCIGPTGLEVYSGLPFVSGVPTPLFRGSTQTKAGVRGSSPGNFFQLRWLNPLKFNSQAARYANKTKGTVTLKHCVVIKQLTTHSYWEAIR